MKKTKIAALSALMLGVSAQASADNNLFSPVLVSVEQNSYELEKEHVIANNSYKLNAGALSSDSQAIAVQLKPGLSVSFNKKSASVSNSGSMVWQGVLSSLTPEAMSSQVTKQQNSAVLVEKDGKVTGTIRYEGNLYRIKPSSNGVHNVEQIDESKLQDHADGYVDPAPQNDVVAQAATSADAPVIDVLVAYTSKAASLSGGIDALIDLAITETNNGYSASGINASVNLVHKYQVNYTEASNSETDLNRLAATSDGYMDEVHSLRTQYGADIVLLVHDTNGYCGQADAIYANASSAFAIVDYDCATGYYSFGHELGHLQGARHDPSNDPTTTPFAYGHGYQDPSENWRTVMAYNCRSGCTRQLFWSNPDKTYNGTATGTASDSNNARVLNETASVMAAFSSGSTTPPPTNTELKNGVAVPNLAGGQLNFTFDVPATATEAKFVMSGGSGDADLYVKRGSGPTKTNYDCRSWNQGNSEECKISSPQSGKYYVLLDNYTNFNGVTLTASFTEGGSTNPTTGSESNLSGSAGTWKYFTVTLPTSASKFTVTTSGGSGDADLYIRHSSQPATNRYDCRSWNDGNSESCVQQSPNSGEWHIGIRAYRTYSGVNLNWSYE